MKYNPEMERVHTAPITEELAARPEVFVSREEGVYFQKISAVCDRVTERHIHILLITGPSASGKTTTAKKIAHELRELRAGPRHSSRRNSWCRPECI